MKPEKTPKLKCDVKAAARLPPERHMTKAVWDVELKDDRARAKEIANILHVSKEEPNQPLSNGYEEDDLGLLQPTQIVGALMMPRRTGNEGRIASASIGVQ